MVGKTTTVAKNESIVLLISDESCKVASKVEGSNERGILSGRRIGEGEVPTEMQLNFLSKKANLQPGQKVYTEGVTREFYRVFPSGIFLGSVKSFQARPLDGQAIVEPAVDLSTVEDVFVSSVPNENGGWLVFIGGCYFCTIVIQEFIPPLRFLHGARVFLVPMLFCYGALSMPFWAMLLMAIYTGFLTDLAT